MKITEVVLTLIAFIGFTMSLSLVPGGSVLIVLSLSTLSLWYFAFGFAIFNGKGFKDLNNTEAMKALKLYRVIGGAATGMALSITVIGILFKFQSYPSLLLNLTFGLVLLGIIIIAGLAGFIIEKSTYYINIFIRIIIWGGLGLTLLLLPKTALTDFKYRKHPALRDAINAAHADPNNDTLWDKVDEERDVIDAGKDSAEIRKSYQSRRNRQH